MLICEKDGEFHIVRKITKSGLNLSVLTYCGKGGFQGIDQLPDEFLPKLHDTCQELWGAAKKAAE